MIDLFGCFAGWLFLKNFIFYLLQFIFQAFYHREIAVNNKIHNGIQNETLAFAQQIGHSFTTGPHFSVGYCRAMPDHYNEVLTYKKMCFTKLNIVMPAFLRS